MLPLNFQRAIAKIRSLEKFDRYRSAFVFGSAAREEVTEQSDLDVIVIVTGESCPFGYINHPTVEGVKLDITFLTQDILEKQMFRQRDENRVPFIAESSILFDKDGLLVNLKKHFSQHSPTPMPQDGYMGAQFQLYHANNKIERHLHSDPAAALLSMHVGIGEILKIYYRIKGRWWVSDKRLLRDLEMWDSELNRQVRLFLFETDLLKKFSFWSRILHHIRIPMNGEMNVTDMRCSCEVCQEDLKHISA